MDSNKIALPKVSLTILTRNSAKGALKILESLGHFSYLNFETIVVGIHKNKNRIEA
jgi:hypothetical protein